MAYDPELPDPSDLALALAIDPQFGKLVSNQHKLKNYYREDILRQLETKLRKEVTGNISDELAKQIFGLIPTYHCGNCYSESFDRFISENYVLSLKDTEDDDYAFYYSVDELQSIIDFDWNKYENWNNSLILIDTTSIVARVSKTVTRYDVNAIVASVIGDFGDDLNGVEVSACGGFNFFEVNILSPKKMQTYTIDTCGIRWLSIAHMEIIYAVLLDGISEYCPLDQMTIEPYETA